MNDSCNRIHGAAKDLRELPSEEASVKALEVFMLTVVGDLAGELADLVAGRLVNNGCGAQLCKEVGHLIRQHAERFDIG